MRLIVCSPAAVWRTIVSTRSATPPVADRHGVPLTPLQEEGASRAVRMLEQYAGVIIADSVGMGKTFIALRIIERARAAGQQVLIIAPATLRPKWQRALGTRNDEVIVISHARLARAGVADVLRQRIRCDRPLIVVDEAHQFRNPRTARYRALSRFTAGAHVVLLTATPINNRRADLYWLLRLFLGDGDLRTGGIPSLRDALLVSHASSTAAARRVSAQVVIRRTRADLPPDAVSHVHRFPRRAPPTAVHYDLAACYPQLVELPAILEQLRLAPFRLSDYMPGNKQPPTDTLVKIGLIKRLESSTWAFQRSIDRLLRFIDLSANAAAAGGFLHARDAGRGDPLQLALTGLLARPLPVHTDREKLLDDLAIDQSVLQQLRRAAESSRDPKAEQLERLLAFLDGSPRVVFTQYAETAERLFTRLQSLRVALLHGSRAALASGTISRRAVLERFAPAAMGACPPATHEQISTLICTDVLAEGLDLQDAQHCISYDLPWNPVRLMQRVGRIDRMNSPHEHVYSWYFSPDHTVEELLYLLRRLRGKIKTIETSIGRDAPVLAGSRGGRSQPERQRLHSGSVWERLKTLAEALPAAAACDSTLVAHVRTSFGRRRVGVFAIRASGYGWWEALWLEQNTSEPSLPTERQIAQLLLEIHRDGLSDARNDQTYDLVRCALARRRALSESRSSGDLVRAAAREIRLRLARIPGAPPPRICDAAERVLLRLGGGLPLAQERALRAILRAAGDADAATLLGRVEGALATRPLQGAAPRVTAILIVEGPGTG